MYIDYLYIGLYIGNLYKSRYPTKIFGKPPNYVYHILRCYDIIAAQAAMILRSRAAVASGCQEVPAKNTRRLEAGGKSGGLL